ncbi:DUF3515 domain-containing protein [Actinoplanes aureus]|jgi:hypothetical protein|uniref:DUF3515 domain-containing protein n=1 Tax=Actinoplanes aureus TaxID=2792083 RepID=A0A931FX28_9ACTN|nr:DUF3515 domain-containing protein [Actinoplanes aureus]MBG0562020.1 DUF3515 domain-containing protein [Actinoplanes aureus]
MVNVDTPKTEPQQPDRTNRVAALWATAVAVPVALIVGVVAFLSIQPEKTEEPDKKPIPNTAVQMAAPKLDERAAQVCLAVTSQLPLKVRDLPARKVSAGPEQNAAYGEPPLTVACGVPQPVMCESLEDTRPGCVPLDTELLIMNRVCWYPKPGDGSATLTTMDREVPVQVTVPAAYENPAQWANEFSDTIVKTVKSTTDGLPSGCKIG